MPHNVGLHNVRKRVVLLPSIEGGYQNSAMLLASLTCITINESAHSRLTLIRLTYDSHPRTQRYIVAAIPPQILCLLPHWWTTRLLHLLFWRRPATIYTNLIW